MNREELLVQAKRLFDKINASIGRNPGEMESCRVQVIEFLRQFAGENSTFYEAAISHSHGRVGETSTGYIAMTFKGFIEYIEAGLFKEIPPERESELNLMSDYLSQAQILLDDRKVHPAAAAMVIGATLEEFLRTWVIFKEIPIEDDKENISHYANALRGAELVTKQDIKEITSWAGLRNEAAHGRWDEVSDRKRIQNMRDGVNLFMTRYRYG